MKILQTLVFKHLQIDYGFIQLIINNHNLPNVQPFIPMWQYHYINNYNQLMFSFFSEKSTSYNRLINQGNLCGIKK